MNIATRRNDALRLQQREFLEYGQSMLCELNTMAAAQRLPMVSYLISMAYLEVCETLRRGSKTSVAKIAANHMAAIDVLYDKSDNRKG